MKWGIYICALLLSVTCRQNEKPPYAIDEEISIPIVFSGNEISTLNGISFSKTGDQLYISKTIDKKFNNDRSYAGIFRLRYKNGKWTAPEKLIFDIEIDAYHPVLSFDNQQLFFNSRSHLDSGNTPIPHNIWVAEISGDTWGNPQMVEVINSSSYDSYPSIARNQNLYFNSDRPGGKGGMDIYVSKFVNGRYQAPQNIESINSSYVENDLVVDPDERFIIFNRYIHESRAIDLFISFKKENDWTAPHPLDNINTDAWELTPTLSPDGNYFFYELDGVIMQMDLAYLIYQEELEALENEHINLNNSGH